MDNARIETVDSHFARIYMSGPIEQAKQILRKECMREGLCVTIDPTLFIYTGGEEAGFVVGLLNYPRFPSAERDLLQRAFVIAKELMAGLFQWSALVEARGSTTWITTRPEGQN